MINKSKKLISLLGLSTALVFSSVNVSAAFAQAEANIDWSTFSISVLSPSLVLSIPGQRSEQVEAYTDSSGVSFDQANSWSSLSESSVSSYAFGQAYTTLNIVNSYSESDGEYSDADASRSEIFNVASGSGFVEISVDAYIDSYVSGELDEFAYAKAGIVANVNGSGVLETSIVSELDANLSGESEGVYNTTLTLLLDLNAGDVIDYTVYTSTSSVAPVPLPASLFLMLSGLGFLIQVKRS